jgi:hypothetical protein
VIEVVIAIFRALLLIPRYAFLVIHWACPVVAVHMASNSEVHSVLLQQVFDVCPQVRAHLTV